MEFLVAFVNPVVNPVVEYVFVPVKKHLGYLFFSTKHVGNMSTRMEDLHRSMDDVKNHRKNHNMSDLVIPEDVPEWLEDVVKISEVAKSIEEDAEKISSNVNGCFNVKMRFQTGRKASKTTQHIKALIEKSKKITWTDAQNPLGEVSSNVASTSGTDAQNPLGEVSSNVASTSGPDGDTQNDFKSREVIFKEALSLLKPGQKPQVIALCGMGGVGKTTMMEQLTKAVDKNMFDWVVKVVIGEKINTYSIQQTMAEYLPHPLTETSETARAERLRIRFEKMSQESQKVLVALDDVWEKVELKDIGLNPLPEGFKLLLTSRNENVCAQISKEADLDLEVVTVNVMEESEANYLFCQISKELNPELQRIGAKIVRRCGFLPFAITLIAANLKSKEKPVWRDTLRRLEKHQLYDVQSVIEISYNFIAKEKDAEKVFLLCALFPDDFNIPIEDLTIAAFGRKLFSGVTTLGQARDRTKACVNFLKEANLLMDSDHSECVKMHDLVLSFVVAKVSKGDCPWIIKHGDVSEWSRAEMRESYRSISLTCMGMSEFPRDFNFPNVSLLRLTNGNESLKIPKDLYAGMKGLEAVAIEKLKYPLLPRTFQCSPKLQTLCIHQCSLEFDLSFIGNLLTLKVLSFAHSGIRYLPSAIGNLVELNLLDLTGCIDLCIDEAVVKKLVKLQELKMTAADERGIGFGNIRGVKFTDINYKELAECSKNLSTLEVEFFEKNPQSKNMCYKNLERFKITMGCFLNFYGPKDMHSSQNTLKLVTNKDELLESGMNELFPKTEVLYLQVRGMNNLGEVLQRHSSFSDLRALYISRCADLRYLFTVPVANGLFKLEDLTIQDCPNVEVLVYSENGEEGDIKLQELKCLSLVNLPMLVALSNTNNVIDLPQLVTSYLEGLPNFTSIFPEYKSSQAATSDVSSSSSSSCAINKSVFSKQVMIPKLATLKIYHMEALKNIWPCGSSEKIEEVDACFRMIIVGNCNNLMNMFPSNRMPLLNHLERIDVRYCDSIKVLVYSENGKEGVIKFAELKHLYLSDLPMLVGFSNTNDVINLPQLGELELYDLPNLTSIYPEYKSEASVMSSSSAIKPLFNNKVMIPRLEILKIYNMEALQNIWPCGSSEEIDGCLLRYITVEDCDNLVNLFPRNPLPLLHHLETITVSNCGSIEVLFDIDDVGCLGEIKEGGIKLRSIEVSSSKKLREVWRLKGIINPNLTIRAFQAVEEIEIFYCTDFSDLFTPTTAKFELGARNYTESIYRKAWSSTREVEENDESVNRGEKAADMDIEMEPDNAGSDEE